MSRHPPPPRARAALLALLAWASPAAAEFHAWEINEIYSSADGSIQFIELFTASDAEHQVGGHAISSSLESHLFEADLPDSFTENRFFLVGTASYAAAPGAVAPDYTVPEPFFDVDGDTIDYASIDAVTFAGGELPLDGLRSIDRNLQAGLNTPTNFDGDIGQLPEPGAAACYGAVLGTLLVFRALSGAGEPSAMQRIIVFIRLPRVHSLNRADRAVAQRGGEGSCGGFGGRANLCVSQAIGVIPKRAFSVQGAPCLEACAHRR